MSYTEIRSLTTTFTMALLYAVYAVFAFPRLQMTDPLRSWAITMLIFGSLTIAMMIIIQVLFHVLFSVGIAVKAALNDPENVDEARIGQSIEGQFVEDERDKMLLHKSGQVTTVVSSIGFFAGLVSLVMEASPVVMLNLIFAAGFFGAILERITTLLYYRKGF